MRERLPSEFKNHEAALLVVFFNNNKQVTLGILLPPNLASELATMLYLMSVSLSLPSALEKVTSKGGDEDVVSLQPARNFLLFRGRLRRERGIFRTHKHK
jgi:hypothetical protein